MEWVAIINKALEEDRFVLFQQCIVPLAENGETKLDYEFLVRMSNDAGETILPSAFIPAAERFDLMSRLDRWVIGAAFAQIQAKVVVAQILSQFELDYLDQSVRPHMGATLEPRPGVFMKVRRRSNAGHSAF